MVKQPNGLDVARMMIRRHGLRAQAVALERVAEMRQQHDAAGLDHWQQAYAAIRELRRTDMARAPAERDAATL
jgi:hypothetical protein